MPLCKDSVDDLYSDYPHLDVKPEELIHFFDSHMWQQVCGMLQVEKELILAKLLDVNNQELGAVNAYRGSISAYDELMNLGDDIKQSLVEEGNDVK